MQNLHHENTGSWFLNGPEFNKWKANPGFLWIRASSGAGKSVLCSTVIRAVSTAAYGQSSAVVYFYFDFTDDKRQRLDIMLRSLVFQLSARLPPPYRALGRLHGTLSGVPPHREDLLKVLDEVLSELSRCYIVLDALDEGNEADFHRLVHFIKTLLGGPNKRSLHLLFTSQPRQIFTEEFGDVTLVELESDATENDIRSFIENRVSHLKSWATQAERVTEQVVQKSSGMFRLAACLLQELSHCFWSEEWEETLKDLPSDLYGIYHRFLSRLSPRHLVYVQAMFRWLIFSALPVTLDELADAIAFDFSNPSKFIYFPSRRKGNVAAIIGWLDGLIIINKAWHWDWPTEQALVTLAHASVQDCILSKQFTDKFAPGCDFTEQASHTFLAQSSIHYLLHFAHAENLLNAETFQDYPLSLYAAKYRFHHLQRCNNRDALFNLTIQLLEDGSSQYNALDHLHCVDGRNDSPNWTGQIPSPFHLCITIGYTEAVCFLLDQGADVDDTFEGKWGHRVTPLQTAAAEGFLQIVRLLLERGANLLTKTREGSSLWHACCKGHTDVVRILLEHGAITNPLPGAVPSALEGASRDRHMGIVKMLLEHGGITGLPDRTVSEVLEAASEGGRPYILHLLLDNGADIKVSCGKFGGVLQAASAGGTMEIINLLLDKGADVNDRGGKYSALQTASEAGHSNIVRFLLDKGAKVNDLSKEFGDALQAAAGPLPPAGCFPPAHYPDSTSFIANRMDILHLLLDNGANVNTMGGKYGGALQAASAGGALEIVKVLLDKGAEVGGKGGSSPLLAASEAGHTEIARFLLENGAMVTAQELYATSRKGHHDTVVLLLGHGADVNSKCREFSSPLQEQFKQRDRTETIRVLLEKGANIDVADEWHSTALQITSGWGHREIVDLLLEKGANFDAVGSTDGTPLQVASRWVSGEPPTDAPLVSPDGTMPVIKPGISADRSGHMSLYSSYLDSALAWESSEFLLFGSPSLGALYFPVSLCTYSYTLDLPR
ncbi:ankyrin repeat-containing domain protein [Mycena maculata]|uniref:Ankyrin repeat-containing domain protein n=1 Tax=Mycena maculata TaxID=230809 RepID=A0AAD7IG68_9AGAR|nr:ankyrin repeat-containing domain protein [Mycena maculata]